MSHNLLMLVHGEQEMVFQNLLNRKIESLLL